MGRLDFGRPTAYPAPPIAHALHDDDADVVDGDVVEAVQDGLPTEPKLALPLGCRWRVPLTQVHCNTPKYTLVVFNMFRVFL